MLLTGRKGTTRNDEEARLCLGTEAGWEARGCHPDEACDTCAVYLDFLSQFRGGFPPYHRSMSLLEPGPRGGCTALEFTHGRWIS